MFHRFKLFAVVAALAFVSATPAKAASKLEQNDQVGLQMILMEYIDNKMVDDHVIYFDPASKKLVKFYPANLHPRIIASGDVYFLCADFRDEKGAEVDVDFVATRIDGRFHIIQTMINNRDVVREVMKSGT